MPFFPLLFVIPSSNNWCSRPPGSTFDFTQRCYLRWWFGPFRGVTQFSLISPMQIGSISQVIKLVFILLICLLPQKVFITKNLQELTKNCFSTPTLGFIPYNGINGGLQSSLPEELKFIEYSMGGGCLFVSFLPGFLFSFALSPTCKNKEQ